MLPKAPITLTSNTDRKSARSLRMQPGHDVAQGSVLRLLSDRDSRESSAD